MVSKHVEAATQSFLFESPIVERVVQPTNELKPCVSMTRVEVVLLSLATEVPAALQDAFDGVQWIDAGGSNCYSIFGCDLSRALRPVEEEALVNIWFAGEIRDYFLLVR